jgi:hypothetical protein
MINAGCPFIRFMWTLSAGGRPRYCEPSSHRARSLPRRDNKTHHDSRRRTTARDPRPIGLRPFLPSFALPFSARADASKFRAALKARLLFHGDPGHVSLAPVHEMLGLVERRVAEPGRSRVHLAAAREICEGALGRLEAEAEAGEEGGRARRGGSGDPGRVAADPVDQDRPPAENALPGGRPRRGGTAATGGGRSLLDAGGRPRPGGRGPGEPLPGGRGTSAARGSGTVAAATATG